MAVFQSEYNDATSTIDNIVSSQLSSVLDWINMPGGLTKVVSSASGYAWGYNSSSVWSCQLPCSGNWLSSDLSSYSVGTILDIVADDTTVYILYITVSGVTNILTTSSNRQGVWTSIYVPLPATAIFSTHTYIWAQDAQNNKQMCPKPCTMSNWIPSTETTITITSSTNTHLYGKDPTGNPVQTDETMRSGWYPISAFGDTKVSKVVGSDSTIYAIDEAMNPIKTDGKIVTPLDTSGYKPVSLTTGNNQLWMTSVTPGSLGNVFNRIESPDYMSIKNTVSKVDQKRDEIVSNIESKYNLQTDIMTVNKQSHDVIDFFKRMFKLDRNTATKANAQAGHITEQIRSTQKQLDQINAVEPVMQVAIVTLLIISAIYVVLGGLLGWVTHILAIIALGVGLFFILKFK